MPPTSFFSILFSGGWVGISIVLVLLGLSLIALYLIIEQLLFLRRSTLVPSEVGARVRSLLDHGRVAQASEYCQQRDDSLSRILGHALQEAEGGYAAAEKAAEDALSHETARIGRRAEYLSVIGNLAPMLGLLGTVTGMIIAFQQVALTQGAAGAGELAEGIYQALVTTVLGLMIAIPSLGAFAVLRNRVDAIAAEAAFTVTHVLSPLKRSRPNTPNTPNTPVIPPATAAPPEVGR